VEGDSLVIGLQPRCGRGRFREKREIEKTIRRKNRKYGEKTDVPVGEGHCGSAWGLRKGGGEGKREGKSEGPKRKERGWHRV